MTSLYRRVSLYKLVKFCSKSLLARSLLTKHHSFLGKKKSIYIKRFTMYSCHFCVKSYKWPQDLKRHLQVIHDIRKCDLKMGDSQKARKDERPTYRCSICSKIYNYKYSLKRHFDHHHKKHVTDAKCSRPVKVVIPTIGLAMNTNPICIGEIHQTEDWNVECIAPVFQLKQITPEDIEWWRLI